ncbi:MAG TPA: CopG family transcriptional regulator, partial [Cyanobacteria bacterium UBA11162]|nr:CopG family transcriptional regulator [Cyanobacteria bacterium UBA11162]
MANEKRIFFRLTDEELQIIELFCQQHGRTKSDVLRELIRTLKVNEKP